MYLAPFNMATHFVFFLTRRYLGHVRQWVTKGSTVNAPTNKYNNTRTWKFSPNIRKYFKCRHLSSFLDWGQWSECREGCGHRGFRYRQCLEDNNNDKADNEKCSGNHTERCFNDQIPCFGNTTLLWSIKMS